MIGFIKLIRTSREYPEARVPWLIKVDSIITLLEDKPTSVIYADNKQAFVIESVAEIYELIKQAQS